jgi:hypothetical protein
METVVRCGQIIELSYTEEVAGSSPVPPTLETPNF